MYSTAGDWTELEESPPSGAPRATPPAADAIETAPCIAASKTPPNKASRFNDVMTPPRP